MSENDVKVTFDWEVKLQQLMELLETTGKRISELEKRVQRLEDPWQKVDEAAAIEKTMPPKSPENPPYSPGSRYGLARRVNILLTCTLVLFPLALGKSDDHIIVCWDHCECDVNGNPDWLAAAQYAVTTLDANLNLEPDAILAEKTVDLITGDRLEPVDWRQLLRDAGVPEHEIQDIVAYRADLVDDLFVDPYFDGGGAYMLWARVKDMSAYWPKGGDGNWSEWANAKEPLVLPNKLPPVAPVVLGCGECSS